MGERRMYPELMGDLSSISTSHLQDILGEIASGMSCFGLFEEWSDWYHYLLPRLIPRSHEAYVTPLLEILITAFFSMYPNGINPAPYRQFTDDILKTLGCCMMVPECWDGDDIIVGRILHRSNNNPNKVWGWCDASGDFSSSMFLCLKYLPSILIKGWFKSVLAISSPHWRAQVIVWLVGAHELLQGEIRWPSELREGFRPEIEWEWSHCLRPDMESSKQSDVAATKHFLPRSSREIVLETVEGYFTEEVYLTWLASISSVPYLEAELASIPSTFESVYVQHEKG